MTGRLSGRVVATTREGEPDDPLALALRAEGAEVRSWPTLSFAGPGDPEPLRAALARLDAFAWLVFTSPRAATAVTSATRWVEGCGRVAAVGESTAEALRSGGWPVHLVGEGQGARGLVEALAGTGSLEGTQVAFFAGSLARPTVEEGLSALGGRVHRVETYRTEVSAPDAAAVRADLARGVAAVLFASPSAVAGLVEGLGGNLAGALGDAVAVAIGPTTSRALRDAGVTQVVMAEEASTQGLVEACAQALDDGR
ncbi:MAG: uroporphyrinogen III methyltransferase [Gemmatimonadota bacterium]